jgi:hypothetical protein
LEAGNFEQVGHRQAQIQLPLGSRYHVPAMTDLECGQYFNRLPRKIPRISQNTRVRVDLNG